MYNTAVRQWSFALTKTLKFYSSTVLKYDFQVLLLAYFHCIYLIHLHYCRQMLYILFVHVVSSSKTPNKVLSSQVDLCRHSRVRSKFCPNGGRFSVNMAQHCSDLIFILSTVDEEGKTNNCTWSAGWTLHARWGCNEWANWVFLLQKWSGVECLFVEQGGKKMGGGDPLKISSRSCFVKTVC